MFTNNQKPAKEHSGVTIQLIHQLHYKVIFSTTLLWQEGYKFYRVVIIPFHPSDPVA